MLASITVLNVAKGKKQQFVEMIGELVEKTNLEEGCLAFNLFTDTGSENTIAFIESWKDQAAIDFHFNTDFFKRIVPEALKLCTGDPVYGGKFESIF